MYTRGHSNSQQQLSVLLGSLDKVLVSMARMGRRLCFLRKGREGFAQLSAVPAWNMYTRVHNSSSAHSNGQQQLAVLLASLGKVL